MAGSYCLFCGHRCFVYRVLPSESRWRPGERVHLATCLAGAANDRDATGGFDHTNTLNPITGRLGSS